MMSALACRLALGFAAEYLVYRPAIQGGDVGNQADIVRGGEREGVAVYETWCQPSARPGFEWILTVRANTPYRILRRPP
jgi:hypothetical protein